MINVVYFGLTLIIAIFDSFFKQAPYYTIVNVTLRICILLPLIFVIIKGQSKYANVLRKTLWLVVLADILLPVYFPAGMIVFLFVHLFNSYNFYQYIELSRKKILSIIIPGIITFGIALSLYFFVLFPSLEEMFQILVGVYLVPIALAWSFSITNSVQNQTRWTQLTSIGMFLFFFTDFQVAAEFLTSIKIPLYGTVNAFTYYSGLYLMSYPTKQIN